jgi:hypothetical protein
MTPPNGTGPPRPTRPSRGSRPPGEPTERPGLPAQGERGQRAPGPAPVGAPRRPVHVPAAAGAGRHQLAGRAGDPLRRHPAQGLGRQPDLGGRAGAVGPDVGVADVLATGAVCPGLPQSTPAGPAAGLGVAPVNDRALSLASPAGRGRIPTADTKLPEVQARRTAPAGNARRAHRRGEPGQLIPAVLA